MLTLTLLRHAKSSWDDETLSDFERPLSKRGLKAAPKIGRALAGHTHAPDCILCSTAVRTRQTLALVLKELPESANPLVRYEDSLYHALPEVLLEHIQTRAGLARHLMLVGHNPGLEFLAAQLVKSGSSDDIEAMAKKFPTAAFARFTFEATAWHDVRPATGTLETFVRPRTL